MNNGIFRMFLAGLVPLLLFHSATANANEVLARQNYILNCQGCHLPDGSGSEGNVPKMNDFVGYFLHVPGGREFIVQVPGAAGAPISDQELADVMNWMLLNFSKNELPEPVSCPMSAEEIGKTAQGTAYRYAPPPGRTDRPHQGQAGGDGILTKSKGGLQSVPTCSC